MDALKRKRTQFRKDFTRAADALEEAFQKHKDESESITYVEGKFNRLSDCAEELFACEIALRDFWCESELFEETAYEHDQDRAAQYKARWSELKAKHQNLTESNKNSENASSLKSAHSTMKHQQERKVKMPKLEITKFNGEVKRWLLFWGQFVKIDEDPDINDSDKFQYLLQSMEPHSNARQLVESYPPSGKNYKKALDALKSRYARDDVLIETYVRGLLALMQEKGQRPSNAKELPALYDSLQMHLQALETLGVTKDKYASILFPMVESALPNEVLRAWNRYRAADSKINNDLSKLVDFLRLEVESEERIQLAHHGMIHNSIFDPKEPTCCFVTETKPENHKNTSVCLWCDKDTHCTAECHKASKMTLEQRTDFIKARKACLICLRPNHTAKRCKSFPNCLFCKKRHSVLMCPDMNGQSISKNKPEPEKSNNLHCELKSTTLLQTVVVQVSSNDGKKLVRARALIDSGAQRSYVRKDLVEMLDLKPTRKEFITHCVFGGKEESSEERQIYDISVRSLTNDFEMKLSTVEQKTICGFLPKIKSSEIIQQLKQRKIVLTETTDSPDDVQLLIGADFSGLLLTGEFVYVSSTLTAIKTRMGWTIQGPVTGIYSSLLNMTTTLHCLSRIDLSDLWNLESLGIKDPAEQSSKGLRDAEVLENFEKSITVNEEGRYEVSLPWCNVPRPQTNYYVANRRLSSTTHRLQQLGKITQYDEVFKQWLELGIIEVAPDQGIKGHYMPHHAIIKEASLTTKIRPVFDASARDTNGISLNSCLEKGVNLLEQIPQLLINFRKEAIGVTADITKAFLQISLSPSDRDYLRFLWWLDVNDTSKGTVTYRHRRVVFGVASSPFHLIATINHHLDSCPTDVKETAMKLKKAFYVDNCVTSVGSEVALKRFINESKKLMSDGKFDLRGWVSSPVKVCDQTRSMSVLGVLWHIEEDCLTSNADTLKITDGRLTKRTLLSVMQRVFDPIGVVCATSVIPKMILQKTWPLKLTWDEELPADLANEFITWLDQAHFINKVKIPRRFTTFSLSESENSLHVFCDASQVAHAICIFLRAKCGERVDLSLVQARSRVTPISKLKKITIPRLELIAATLGARLAQTVMKSLALENCPVYYWSDSSVVLTWIKGQGDWSVFVTNRVNEIKSFTSASEWRHVPGNLNPADVPSRGILPKALFESRWYEGPDWLRLDEQNWPVADFETDCNEVEMERRKTVVAIVTECDSFLERLCFFSVYSKIVRMICWIFRLRRKPEPFMKELSYDEFINAENSLIRLIQQKYEDTMIKSSNQETFVDDKGIVRLKTKLGMGSESTDFKYPIVLPGNEPIVQRLVHQRHLILQHAGVHTLMCNLRERFWIVGLRRLCRRVVHACVKCKRFKAKPCQPPTGSLPEGRMEASTAFEVSGVDLAGPLLLKSGSKAWIVLFTCATYRAVHLEVVESLSTAEFIMALRRFIARRGRISCLYSDNATNFRGLDNVFKSLDWNEILCFSAITQLKWNFLPASAPWWGGFYERLISVVKSILRRLLGRASVTLTELVTILCDCEASINSRPLTYVDTSVDGLRPLTPAMFIQPLFVHDVADVDQVDRKTLNLRARYCQRLREELRRRFRSEYLSTLTQTRSPKFRGFKVGDVVLVEVPNDHRRVHWPIGLVTEVFEGQDKVNRVARIRTAKGELVRPAQRLYPLEISSADRVELLDRPLTLTRRDKETIGESFDSDNGQEKLTITRSGRIVRPPSKFKDFRD